MIDPKKFIIRSPINFLIFCINNTKKNNKNLNILGIRMNTNLEILDSIELLFGSTHISK